MTERTITKFTQILQRDDGSEVRIVAQACFGIGLTRSIDVYVHRRESPNHDWKLCSDRPHPNWKKMSVDDYIKHGRSEMRQAVSPGEILKVVSAIGRPIAPFKSGPSAAAPDSCADRGSASRRSRP